MPSGYYNSTRLPYKQGFQKGHIDLVPSSSRLMAGLKTRGKKKNFKDKGRGKNHWKWIEDRSLIKHRDKHSLTNTNYLEWRNGVFTRDKFKCKMINQDCEGQLEAHHILDWKNYPELRYEIKNGITLCHSHHPRGRDKEKRLAPIFQELVSVSN